MSDILSTRSSGETLVHRPQGGGLQRHPSQPLWSPMPRLNCLILLLGH